MAALKQVLIVDDDPDMRDLVSEILGQLDCRLETAADGLEALDHMHRHPPDVVLLDLMMPVMDGWQFVAACREDPAYAHLRVGVMSAASGAGKVARDLGASAYLAKPFQIDDLVGVVSRLLTA
jgi:two-component system chemotaxis response regulator CheY